MAVKIGHAVGSEHGTREGVPGDQTGKEIRIQDWYKRDGGWGCLLECTDPGLAAKAAEIMREICESPAFGYSRNKRWTGYHAIVNNGGKVDGAADSDFDCSSLCITCYVLAGLKHKAAGYTGSMRKSLLATGKFVASSEKDRLTTSDYAKVGSLYLAEGHHVCMALSNGAKVKDEPQVEPDTPPAESPPEEPTKPLKTYVKFLGNVYVREQPFKQSKAVLLCRKGDLLPYYGAEAQDADGGKWYAVDYRKDGKSLGFTSAFTNKPRKYTRLVEN